MTQDEIIEMAIGIGLEYRQNNNEINTPYCDGIHIDELRLFAELVAQHEREACAKLADEQLMNTSALMSMPPKSSAAWNIASAIRARSNT